MRVPLQASLDDPPSEEGNEEPRSEYRVGEKDRVSGPVGTIRAASALLHSDELPRSKGVAEVEVESVAYIVCDAIGLDSGDYSFAYVARWAEGSVDLLKETGERVIVAARSILEGLELNRSP